jgi:Flp pilus assembly protein TadB
MACCALRKRKKQLMVVPLGLLTAVYVVGGLLIGLFALAGLVSRGVARRRDRARRTVKQLTDGLKDRILNEPFLFDSTVRCKVSGRLMGRSTRLAGLVFKYFNLLVFAGAAASVAIVVGGFFLAAS